MTFRVARVEENERKEDCGSKRTHTYNYHSAIMATVRWTQSADRFSETRADRRVEKGRMASNFAGFFS
jgi:hypothetical protein